MDNLAIIQKIYQFNLNIFQNIIDNLKKHEQIKSTKKFKKILKNLEHFITKAPKLMENFKDITESEDLFLDFYELIYKKYLNEDLITYYHHILVEIPVLHNTKIFHWIFDFWFFGYSFQWWWYQLSQNIDYNNDDLNLSSALETSVYKAFIIALKNIINELNVEKDNNIDTIKNIELITDQFNTIHNYQDFQILIKLVSDLKPKTGVLKIVESVNELDFYKLNLYMIANNYDQIMNFLKKDILLD